MSVQVCLIEFRRNQLFEMINKKKILFLRILHDQWHFNPWIFSMKFICLKFDLKHSKENVMNSKIKFVDYKSVDHRKSLR